MRVPVTDPGAAIVPDGRIKYYKKGTKFFGRQNMSELGKILDAGDILANRLRQNNRGSTHYAGCEYDHLDCMALKNWNLLTKEPRPAAEETGWWVVVRDKPQMYTSRRHDTFEAAFSEAERLCKKEGAKFFVLKVIGMVEPGQVVWKDAQP